MNVTATDGRSGKRPLRVKWLSGIHFMLATVLLVAIPPALNEWLSDTLRSPSYVWVRHGELRGWASAAWDEFFLAPPYWSSYEPGWIVGLLPGLFMVSVAWGLLKQRTWGRRLAIGFHALVVLAALIALAWCVYHYLSIEWAPLRGDHRGGPNPGGGLIVIAYAVVGAIAIPALMVAGGLLWWLRRPATRKCFETTGRRSVRMILACYIGVTLGISVAELVYNRVAVYRGEATYQGKSTGDWLTLLASRDPTTRRMVVEKLGESPEEVPVLREVYCDRLPDPRQFPPYWSRARQTPEWKALTEVWKSKLEADHP